MSTFLQLAQEAARESGLVKTGALVSVVGQTGRLADIVAWTANGYEDLQLSRNDWSWLQATYSGQTVAAQRIYTPAQLGIASRFGGWFFGDYDPYENGPTIYLTADGNAAEGGMTYRDWQDFRRMNDRGALTTETGKPQVWTVNPQENIVLYPIPDAIYTIRGEYRKSPQILAADGDIPEMPERHHKVIVRQALIQAGAFMEEAQKALDRNRAYEMGFNALMTDQTPRIRTGGPLA